MGVQQTLANLTYQGLFTSVDGREVAKKLVTALIEQQIGQELGVSCRDAHQCLLSWFDIYMSSTLMTSDRHPE
jgi:hypothetical protein